MVMAVSPSPSVADWTFVGVMGNPRLSAKSLFTMHSAVQPESMTRSSPLDPLSLETLIGKDGDALTHHWPTQSLLDLKNVHRVWVCFLDRSDIDDWWDVVSMLLKTCPGKWDQVD